MCFNLLHDLSEIKIYNIRLQYVLQDILHNNACSLKIK